VLVLAYCGLRWGEASGLRVKDVDLERSRLNIEVTVVMVKGTSGRRHRKTTSFRLGWFNDAATSIGLAGLTPHELRHTAASLAISAGANVKAVQRMLGHAKASVTLDVYADLFEEDLDAVAVSLNAAALQTTVGDFYAAPASD
jgi:integrase